MRISDWISDVCSSDLVQQDPSTIEGTPGNDFLEGTSGDDHIRGLAGNDAIFGLAGDDFLEGDDDSDSLHGDDGADTLYGGDGNGNPGRKSVRYGQGVSGRVEHGVCGTHKIQKK